MMIYGTVVKHWSRTQTTRELSTAEAEYYAVVAGAAEGLGMQPMMAGLGRDQPSASLDGFQRCESDSVEKRSR